MKLNLYMDNIEIKVPKGENNKMKSNFKKSIVALAVGLLFANVAHADLIIDDGSAPVVTQPSKPVFSSPSTPVSSVNSDTGLLTNTTTSALNVQSVSASKTSLDLKNVTQTGFSSSSDMMPVSGFGKDMPLMTALKQVVPNGWKATKVGNVDLNKKVSWRGGESWIAILDDLAGQNHFAANVNWNTKVLTITPVGGSVVSSSTVSTTPVSSAQARNPFSGSSSTSNNFTSTRTNIGSSQLNSAISTTPVYSSTSSTWLLSKDKTLKENVEGWAKQAGWVVSWDAPDYRIIADVTLTGAIDSNDGPVARVIAAYKNAEQPLSAKLSEGNRVIRIESRNFKQETVVSPDMNDTFSGLSTRY